MSIVLPSRKPLLGTAFTADPLWRAARSRPSLDLRFADTKSMVDGVTGQSLVTFTRASSATYIGSDGLIKTAASNESRFDHDSAGPCLGLLVEEARTNLLTYSEQFDNAAWTKTESSVTANAATAPDGTTTADKLVESTATSTHSAGVVLSGSGIVRAFSVFAKAAGRRYLSLVTAYVANAWNSAMFDLQDGVITEQRYAGSPSSLVSIAKLPNGWFRICLVHPSYAGTCGINFCLSDTPTTSDPYGNRVYTGDGTSGVLLWGAQLEVGSFPTSYIPTTTATVTRSADVVSITGTNFSSWYNQRAGTILARVIPREIDNLAIWTASDGTTVERMLSYSASQFNFYVDDNSVNQVNIGGYPLTVNALNASACAYSLNDFAFSRNGSAVINDTSGTVPTPNQLRIMAGYEGGQIQNGTISRLTYWPTRLADQTIQEITR